MQVLIYGSRGWIGSKICEQLKATGHIVHEAKSRADDEKNVESEINTLNPSHIMCFIGRTHGKIGDKLYNTIDYLEQEGKLYENIRDNLHGPLVLAILSKKYGKHLTYIGTGCIFEYDDSHKFGDQENGFTETDKPNFFGSAYSIVKGFTDQLMHLFESNVLNLRIRMPITKEKNSRNFITKIVNYKKICSVPNSMTVLDELIPVMIELAQKRTVGTLNLVNPGLISHNEILEMYKEIVDPELKWENFTIEEQNKILSARRSNNCLNASLITGLYPNIRNIKDAVKHTLENYK